MCLPPNILCIILYLFSKSAIICEIVLTPTNGLSVGMCGKPKFGSDSVFKNWTVQKFDIRSDGFPTETVCKSAIYVKSDKKLLYLHSNVHINNGLNTTETEIST